MEQLEHAVHDKVFVRSLEARLFHYHVTRLIPGSPGWDCQVAPVSVVPFEFPLVHYDRVCDAQLPMLEIIDEISTSLQIVQDIHLRTAHEDEFTRKLLEIASIAYRNRSPKDDIRLYLTRDDYMLNDGDSRVYQVELNTTSVSLAGLTQGLSEVHAWSRETLLATGKQLPRTSNCPAAGYALAMRDALKRWSEKYCPVDVSVKAQTVIVFVVLGVEANEVDQRILEFELYEAHRIPVVRLTLEALGARTKLGPDGTLILDGVQRVGLVYYRAGYDPEHYVSESCWNARLLVEESNCVRVPSVLAQLAGSKQSQLYWSLRNASSKDIGDLLQEQYDPESLDPRSSSVISDVLENPEDWVLKPQRQGGGHGVNGNDLARLVREKAASGKWSDLSAYVLMRRMKPLPHPAYVTDVAASATSGSLQFRLLDHAVSELGLFATYIPNIEGKNVKIVGHVVRIKDSRSYEGGIAAGYGFISTGEFVDR